MPLSKWQAFNNLGALPGYKPDMRTFPANVVLALVLSVAAAHPPLVAAEACRIEIVEKGTGWPVPLIELRTVHHARFVSDNAGLIAFDMPELMGRETWFDIQGHGYEVPRDGFGQRGVRLIPQPGQSLKVEVERKIIGRRLGRITGGGIFGESQKLGLEKDWRDGEILGCDSVQNAILGGRLFWFWGDTILPGYPMGIFESTGATTPRDPLGSFEPPVRMRYEHFRNAKGNPRGVAKIPGDGPTWLVGLVALPDKGGQRRMGATYMKIIPPLDPYEFGLCVWNEKTEVFEHLRTVWKKGEGSRKPPEGHSVLWKDPGGKEWVLFGNPLPAMRCAATFEAWQDPSAWETLKPQSSLKSAGDGKAVKPHTGSIAWSGYRKRWVTVFMEAYGSPSVFGELWYAEAEAPLGPWGPAVKILTHENYTFYNPRIHSEFTSADSPVLIFEGTYTMQFADKPATTPRHDYNQVLYRLDLDDSRLKPAAVN